MNNDPSIRKIFMISGGRTATMLFGNRLSEYFPEIFSIHEPDRLTLDFSDFGGLFRSLLHQGIFRMGVLKSLGFAGTRNLSLKVILGKISQEGIESWFNADRTFINFKQEIYFEANAQLFGVGEELLLLPNSRVVFVLRDPNDWIQSMMKRHRYSETDLFWKYDVLGFKRITPNNVGVECDEWIEFNRVEKLAWVWGFLAERFINIEKKHADQCVVLRYEDLIGSGVAPASVQKNFLSLVLGRTFAIDDMQRYEKMITKVVNAGVGSKAKITLPNWFKEKYGTILKQYDYYE